MSRGQCSLLPTELYREIIQHIKCRTLLFSLLTVSRPISYEAERVLYRTICVRVNPRRGILGQAEFRTSRFHHYKRVAHHVLSATFNDICNTTVQHLFIPILLSLTNIKALTLNFGRPCNRTPFVYFRKGNVPFHLLELTIQNYKGDDAMVSLFRSQKTLRKLSWTCNTRTTISLPPSDLPHLTTFSTNIRSLIDSILPCRNVKILDCRDGDFYYGQRFESVTSYPSVQALALSSVRDLGRLPTLFPNLQHLFLGYVTVNNMDETLLPHLNLFKHLNRLKLVTFTDITQSRAVVPQLFACSGHIAIAELYTGNAFLKFKRGFENDESLVSSEPVANINQLDPW